ncbi:adenylate isopentenyltransferase-like [Zingiber officinale]|uniref:Adenylate isopentenyltransferase-like n=1 Tax=Zingiber officinale TaxID=94328 RepID=A0A8J5F4V4_ZINOF|nr:adenylate isopentenyltransferase-like [Zingiber officinale]KAG6482832.1 hypothetical protein ZIOFF_059471 [Zingiber officinale]
MRVFLNRISFRVPLLPNFPHSQRQRQRQQQFYHQQRHHLYSGYGDTKEEEAVVVIMGATGTGKSKLSIDLSSAFAGEVVNSDKIQVYRGLDITTNKISLAERRSVPHHLLGALDPAAGELSRARFRALAACAVRDIAARDRLPVIAGGSNSFVHALLSERFDPQSDPFVDEDAGEEEEKGRRRRRLLRYRCCFLWVHVEAAVLAEYLDRRVEEMLGQGMVEELEEYFATEGEEAERRHPGLGKAIGVSEFKRYFTARGSRTNSEYDSAVAAIKANTRRLAESQVRKMERLVAIGWPLRRVDATATVEARLGAGLGASTTASCWKRDVEGPSLVAVEQLLLRKDGDVYDHRPHTRMCAAIRLH